MAFGPGAHRCLPQARVYKQSHRAWPSAPVQANPTGSNDRLGDDDEQSEPPVWHGMETKPHRSPI